MEELDTLVPTGLSVAKEPLIVLHNAAHNYLANMANPLKGIQRRLETATSRLGHCNSFLDHSADHIGR